MSKAPTIQEFNEAVINLESLTKEHRHKATDIFKRFSGGIITAPAFWSEIRDTLGDNLLGQAISEAKRIVAARQRLLYVHSSSEGNEETRHGIFVGEMKENDRNLLRIRESGALWAPYEDRGANADLALLSYLVAKYPPTSWRKGDPTEWEDFLEACPFPAVKPRIEAVLKEQMKCFDHVITHGYLETDSRLRREVFNQYIDYLKKKLKENPGKLAPELEETIRGWKTMRTRDASPERNKQ